MSAPVLCTHTHHTIRNFILSYFVISLPFFSSFKRFFDFYFTLSFSFLHMDTRAWAMGAMDIVRTLIVVDDHRDSSTILTPSTLESQFGST